MKKLNSIIYNKMLIQAEEAKNVGLTALGSAVTGSLTPQPYKDNEIETYSSGELNNDIYSGLWKLATHVIGYHNLESVDIEKVDEVIEVLAEKFVQELEVSLGVLEGKLGPLEDKVPGQK